MEARARENAGGNRDDANDEGAFERTFASIQSLIVETFGMTRFTDASVERAAEAMDLEGRASVSFATGERSTTGAGDDDATGRGEGGRRGAIAFGRDVYAKRESSASAHGWAHDDLYVDQ